MLGGPVQKLGAERLLEPGHVLGHRPLRHAEPPGRAGEAAVARHLDEHLDAAQTVHGGRFPISKQYVHVARYWPLPVPGTIWPKRRAEPANRKQWRNEAGELGASPGRQCKGEQRGENITSYGCGGAVRAMVLGCGGHLRRQRRLRAIGCGQISGEADQDHRAVRARRIDGHSGTRDRTETDREAGASRSSSRRGPAPPP